MTEEVREALMRLVMCAREECERCKHKDKCGYDMQCELATQNMHIVLNALKSRPKGEWKQVCWKSPIPIEVMALFHYKCDNCNKEVRIDRIERYNYCPNCGADMRGEE